MAGFQIRVDGDWEKFADRLTRLTRISYTALHKRLGETALSQISQRFRRGEDPEGRKWAASGRVKAKGGQVLRDTGRLQRSFSYRAETDYAAIGTNDIRARLHQYGGVVKPKQARRLRFRTAAGDWVTALKVTMPARAMVGFNEDNKRELAQETRDYLDERVNG